MTLQVTYRYRNQVPDEALRRSEGIKVKRRFPIKIPVRSRAKFVNPVAIALFHPGYTCTVLAGKPVHGHVVIKVVIKIIRRHLIRREPSICS